MSKFVCNLTSLRSDAWLRYDHLRWTAPALLQKLVSKRQRYFKSRQEVYQRLADKAPWNRFSQDALKMYVEHAFKDASGDPAHGSNCLSQGSDHAFSRMIVLVCIQSACSTRSCSIS